MNEDRPIKNKLVSIIIPTYNTARFIGEAIISVAGQDYNNWELIIVDDGSTDDTAQVVSQFLSDPRISYVKKENSGVSNTRNFGAALAKGDYFCFLDADDSFYPTNLSEKVKVLEQQPGIALVHADVNIIDESSRPTGRYNTGLAGKDLYLDILLWQECVIPAPSSIMMRREIFYAAGQWDPCFSTAADQDLFIAIAHRHAVYRISHVLTSYRIVNGSMSRVTGVFEKDHLAVYNKAKKNKLFPDKSFERRCFSNLHRIISGSWWHHEKSLLKTMKHLAWSLIYSPGALLRMLKLQPNRYIHTGRPTLPKK